MVPMTANCTWYGLSFRVLLPGFDDTRFREYLKAELQGRGGGLGER